MSSPNYNQKNDYVASAKISASFLNRLVNILDAQIPGALDVLGAGVVRLPDANSLKVTGAGFTLSVAVGRSIIASADGSHLVYGKLLSVAGLGSEEGVVANIATPHYVHAALVVADAAGDPDTEEGADLDIFLSENEEEPGALLLAEFTSDATTVTVTDRRTYSRLDQLKIDWETLQTALQAVVDDIGGDYDEAALGTIKARLAALEGGGGSGGGGTVYWGALVKSLADDTTIDQAIGAAVAQHVTDYHGSGGGVAIVPPEPRDEVAVNLLNALFLLEVAQDDAFDVAPLHRALIVSPGRGHNKDSDPDSLIDYEATTLPYDEVTHLFG